MAALQDHRLAGVKALAQARLVVGGHPVAHADDEGLARRSRRAVHGATRLGGRRSGARGDDSREPERHDGDRASGAPHERPGPPPHDAGGSAATAAGSPLAACASSPRP